MYYKIPNMTSPAVQDYLYELGRRWSGQGVVMELGSWCGGSAAPLLEGLVEAGYDRPFYAFDRWKTNADEVEKLRKWGVEAEVEQDLRPMFLDNVKQVYSDIVTFKGRIEKKIHEYRGDQIEICILDAPKKDPIFSTVINTLKPYWIPGVTVLGLLDYFSYKKATGKARRELMVPVSFIEQSDGQFVRMKEFWPDTSGAFFKYMKK